jgi:lipoyl synthase
MAEAVRRLGIKYAVITSVTRDDLEDGGAGQFARTISTVKGLSPETKVEVLTPDFNGRESALATVLNGEPDVFGHDIETVRRLYPVARRGASYDTSLGLFRTVRQMRPRVFTKSALLVGLGESEEEIIETMGDIKSAGCDILMIGQYLRPGKTNLPVVRYLREEEFAEYKRIGEDMGFRHVSSGAFVRSSYRAEEIYWGIGCRV